MSSAWPGKTSTLPSCPLLDSYRYGVLYNLNGAHRQAMTIELGIEALPVKVLEGLAREQEAKLVKDQDEEVAMVKPAHKFKADITAREETASVIYALCESIGLTATNKTRGIVSPMKAITFAVNIVGNKVIDGADCLYWMLSLMEEAKWFEERKILLGALTSHFMYGFMGIH